ncbi:hypothetical protein EK21DRAFT_93515 [Setomelanomma holmii]|uniref:Uncharacterized protein n=1 Tax=Setomelanomma holmii TaxID=210430 RepID=A0A9P4LH67_9PLEO|nr:hypothetical protein EK21DRAFT_93515 [Setomelanomma holmii]
MAMCEVLYVTFTAYLLPLICRLFLKALVSAVAGALLSEQSDSVPSAYVLLAVYYRTTPDFHKNMLFFRGAEGGVRSVLAIRIVGDCIVHLMVPFVSLALPVQWSDRECWLSFDWGWLLFVLFWPSICIIAAMLYLMKYWGSQQCIQSMAYSKVPAVLQIAKHLKTIIRGEDDNQPPGKWRLGYRVKQGDEIAMIDQSYLGLVREDECTSMTDMLLAMEREDETVGGRLPRRVMSKNANYFHQGCQD